MSPFPVALKTFSHPRHPEVLLLRVCNSRESVPRVECYPLFIRASFLVRKDTRVSFLTLLPFQGANNLSLCTFIISFCLQKERSPRESVPRVKCYPLFIRASLGRQIMSRFHYPKFLSRNPLFIRASFGQTLKMSL